MCGRYRKLKISLAAVGYVAATVYFASAFDALDVRYCPPKERASWLVSSVMGFMWPALIPLSIGVEAWSEQGSRWRWCKGQ